MKSTFGFALTCLLLLALQTPASGEALWRTRGTRPWLLATTILAPVALTTLAGLEYRYRAAAGVLPGILDYVNTTLLGAGISLAVWLFVRHWIAGFRRQVIRPAADE